MMQIGLIGIGAGAAAALLFASVTSGSWLSIILFYLAPLPVMIAGLGWSHWAALTAAFTGAAALAAVFSNFFFFAFLAGAGLPAWWLGYLALLARPGGNGGAPALEWYPVGRLVAWCAGLGALAVIVAIPNFGLDGESVRANLHNALTQLFQLQIDGSANAPQTAQDTAEARKQLIDFLVAAVPPAAAVLSTLTYVINLWLGARVVSFSGRLTRPWPPIAAMTFPRSLGPALALAIVLSFAPGLVGIFAGVAAAALLMAFGVLGFAVLHIVTRTMNARPFLLGGAYAAVLVFGWPVLAICALGLIDTLLDLRGRMAAKIGGPPGST